MKIFFCFLFFFLLSFQLARLVLSDFSKRKSVLLAKVPWEVLENLEQQQCNEGETLQRKECLERRLHAAGALKFDLSDLMALAEPIESLLEDVRTSSIAVIKAAEEFTLAMKNRRLQRGH